MSAPGTVDNAMQQLLDVTNARKSGFSLHPAFLRWPDGVSPDMTAQQQRAALIAFQDRLAKLRMAANQDRTILSFDNFKLLGRKIQDVIQRLRELNKDLQPQRTLDHYIIDAYKAQAGKHEWDLLIKEAEQLQATCATDRAVSRPSQTP